MATATRRSDVIDPGRALQPRRKFLNVDRLSNRGDGLHSLEDFVLHGFRDGCVGGELVLRVIFFLC